jgi:DNA repair exonuclease SbcCD nuclease subunit
VNKAGTVIVGDLHINEACIKEVTDIVSEICSIPAKRLVQLGDLCHSNRLNARELSFLTWVAYMFKSHFEEVHFITGNHDLLDHSVSTISYLDYFGINIHNTDEAYIGGNPNYKGRFDSSIGPMLAGHFFTDKSKDAFGKYKYTLQQLIDCEGILNKVGYHYCFLGHQHDFQVLDEPNGIYHLGSARYVSFAENEKEKKKIAWLHNGILEFVELKSCLPIYNISKYDELLTINSKSKVRYIFTSFGQLKNEIKKVNLLKDKFAEFKIKIDFKNKVNKVQTVAEKTDIKTFVNTWLKSIDDSEVRNILEEEFVQELK